MYLKQKAIANVSFIDLIGKVLFANQLRFSLLSFQCFATKKDTFLDTQVSPAPIHVSRSVRPSMGRSHFQISILLEYQKVRRNLWPLRHLIRVIRRHGLTDLQKKSDFWKIFGKFSDFQIFGRFSDFWKNFRKISDFQKIFRFLGNFQIFGKFSDFWETTTATKTILGLVTLETLITILTIENLNSWQSLLSDN